MIMGREDLTINFYRIRQQIKFHVLFVLLILHLYYWYLELFINDVHFKVRDI